MKPHADDSSPTRPITWWCWLLLLLLTPGLRGDDPQTPPGKTAPAGLKHLSLEELSQIEVTSAGKKEEKLSDVAAALYVITQEEIRRSGVRNIPEALRLATGLEVAIFNNGSWPISARGFDTTSANKIQAFLDGRSLYSPLYGGVFWDVQNIVIEDIDRIEVIRGPGASLWGGNAVNCVVNIITKAAKDTQGGLAVAGGGAGERGFATLRYGGTIGSRAAYRVYGNYFNRDSLALENGADAKDPYQMTQGGFRLDTEPTAADRLTVQGDVYTGDNGILNRPDIGVHGQNLLARWTHRFAKGSDVQMLAYYDRTSRNVPLQFGEVRNAYNFDLQHHFRAGGRHDIVWGLGYRENRDRTSTTPLLFFEPDARNLGLFNIFAQDEIALSGERLRLILGSKFEHYTYTGWNAQPTARLLWTPTGRQAIWGAVSRAVRIPTRFDEDLRITANGTILIRGDSGFRPENLVAYEIGYRALPNPRLSLDIATYYNQYSNLRSQESPPQVIPIVLANRLRGETYGVSLTARYQLQPWWRMTSTYSNLQKSLRPEPGSTDRTGGRQEGIDPHNQLSWRSNMDLPHKTELDFWVRHVSGLQLLNTAGVPAYTVFDIRIGWRPTSNLELAAVGRNLPDRRHLEFGPLGELVRRGLDVSTTWRF